MPRTENFLELKISFELYLLKVLHRIDYLAFLSCFGHFASGLHLTGPCPIGRVGLLREAFLSK